MSTSSTSTEARGEERLSLKEFYTALAVHCEEMFEYYRGEFSRAFRERNIPLANHYSKLATERKRLSEKFAALAQIT